MVWNAAVAYAAGSNTAAAALSSGSAEIAAPIISHWLFNQKDPSKLNEGQKAALVSITGLLDSGFDSATGDYCNIVSDDLIGQAVTEHNNAAQVGKAVGGAAIAGLGCLFDKNCGCVLDRVAETLAEQRRQAQEEQDAIFSAIQSAQNGKGKAQPKLYSRGDTTLKGAAASADRIDTGIKGRLKNQTLRCTCARN
ncbi:hypothetical protein [Neisseria leonii]|uniref:hypothetical protein n=1 Tax=Neisseria leonii TaxID=2995413 RepID=UPI00237AD0E1|nr:hypothetical protein [Neisseria sp. 3986]MDD9324816.1 hypothetical protein [Neisseria sp. 3986]